MICEREMSSAGDGKQLKKMMTECPMVENSKEHVEVVERARERREGKEGTSGREGSNEPPLQIVDPSVISDVTSLSER